MNNTAAEQVLLAGFLKYPSKLLDYIDFLDEEDFGLSLNKVIFSCIKSLVLNKEISSISKSKLISEAKALGHGNFLSMTKNGDLIDDFLNEKIESEEINSLFLEVKRQSLKTAYQKSFDDMADYLTSTADSLSTMISKVENSIVSRVGVLDKGENAPIKLTENIWNFIDNLSNDPGHLGLDIGFPVWQEKVGQIRNGGITLIVATSKAGKSQLALAAAIKAAQQGLPVLLLDSELNQQDQQIRTAAIYARVPFQYIETGVWNMSDEQLKEHGITDEQIISEIKECRRRLQDPELRERINKLNITYQPISGMNISDVIPHIRRWILKDVKPDRKEKRAQCLIVYDYLKLATLDELKSSKNVAEWQLHGVNVSALHDLMRRYNVPCLAFGQTNNEIDDGIRCVAGGKRISENVTSITYLKLKSSDERAIDGNGTHLLKIFGARYGSGTSSMHINIDADLSHGVFKEIGMGVVDIKAEKQRKIDEYKNSRKHDDD